MELSQKTWLGIILGGLIGDGPLGFAISAAAVCVLFLSLMFPNPKEE